MQNPVAYFDGAAEPNPGAAGIGYVILSPEGETILEVSAPIGHATNNVAEYTALIELLKDAIRLKVQNLKIFGDAQLVINQVNGIWQTKQPHLAPLTEQAASLLKQADASLYWGMRERNKRADRLSKIGVKMNGDARDV